MSNKKGGASILMLGCAETKSDKGPEAAGMMNMATKTTFTQSVSTMPTAVITESSEKIILMVHAGVASNSKRVPSASVSNLAT